MTMEDDDHDNNDDYDGNNDENAWCFLSTLSLSLASVPLSLPAPLAVQ